MKSQTTLTILSLLYCTYLSSQISVTFAFSLHPTNHHVSTLTTQSTSNNQQLFSFELQATNNQERRTFLQKSLSLSTIIGLGSATATATIYPSPVNALVKGNAPPPKKKASDEAKKCTNVEECQEMAERLASQQEEEMKMNAVPSKTTANGIRYVDVVSVNDESGNSVILKAGDVATVHYKVLKLGKRSYDGLSGEGTVVFSRGYGLEDDEDKPGQKAFTYTVGDSSVISAMNDATPGMKQGETRRIAVLPQMGWERPNALCDGGPGGKGSGGDLKTDYVVVPTATMVATETCFDKSKLPFPERYDQQRRMAQRFDQSLIVEVELVNIKKS